MLFTHTPVESYAIGKRDILVKREDQCGPVGAPTFSKIRGLIPYLEKLKADNPKLEVVGYVETSISMAGWGVAWACRELGLKCLIFDPQYIPDSELSILRMHRRQWTKYGAVITPVPAGRAKVNWYVAKKRMDEELGDIGHLLPLGLPFPETIYATSNEVYYTIKKQMIPVDAIVVNVGSGTIAAGIVHALYTHMELNDIKVYGIMGRSGNIHNKRQSILAHAEIPPEGSLFAPDIPFIRIIDPGWEYTQKSEIKSPFPSHPYYDLKAWEWLVNNHESIEGSILFWNIGR